MKRQFSGRVVAVMEIPGPTTYYQVVTLSDVSIAGDALTGTISTLTQFDDRQFAITRVMALIKDEEN